MKSSGNLCPIFRREIWVRSEVLIPSTSDKTPFQMVSIYHYEESLDDQIILRLTRHYRVDLSKRHEVMGSRTLGEPFCALVAEKASNPVITETERVHRHALSPRETGATRT